MGRIFEALQRSSNKQTTTESLISELGASSGALENPGLDRPDLDHVSPLVLTVTPEHRLVTLNGQRSLGSEKIRILAARLRHLQDQRPLKRLLITSSVKDEGKTVLSSNIALSLARSRQRVLLVDGDCHQANAGRLFGAYGSTGLTDWWSRDHAIQEYLRKVSELPLWFLPAGSDVEQPVEMLQSERLSALLNDISSWFDWIIIDSPPSAPLADAACWAKLADGILLVTREGKTPKRLLRKVLDSIDASKLLGIVLNDCSDPDQHYYTHYYNLPNKH